MDKKVIFTAVYMTPEMRETIRQFAEKYRISEGEAIRRLIGQALGLDWADVVKWGGARGTEAEPDDPDTKGE